MSSDLWSFALVCYQRPGVEAACLKLQGAGADVCLLLCGVWLERRAVVCEPSRVQALQRIAAPWQNEVVKPLRELRQRWREAARHDEKVGTWRERIKTLELETERELLRRLEGEASVWPSSAAEPSNWLEALAGASGETCRDALSELRAAAAEA